MDIMLYGTTSGAPKEQLIEGVLFDALHEKMLALDNPSFTLIPREIEYEEVFRSENPNWPRTTFKATLKDVCVKGAEKCFLSDEENVDQNEFLGFLTKHRLTYHPFIKYRKDGNTSYHMQAAVIGNKIVGGNDVTVLWDAERKTWKAEWLYR